MNIDGWNAIISVSNMQGEQTMKKEDAIEKLVKMFVGLLSGENGALEIAAFTKESVGSIREHMFNRKLNIVMNELQCNGTIGRKVGKILAESNYGEEYGYTLLHYIDAYEHIDKGRMMAYLLDATSKKFITPDECFRFCKILDDVSLSSLCFLKQNITKRVLYNVDEKDRACIKELRMYDLVYDSENNGNAFSLTGYLLDKYALSYNDEEKYRNYSEKMGDIPSLEQFPKIPVTLVSEGIPYKG